MMGQQLFWLAVKAIFVVSMVFQACFFLIANFKKTDIFTDLSYGLSFVMIVWWLSLRISPLGHVGAVVVSLITLWGLRLAGYLFIRILTIKKDKRFDGIRENSFKFGMFWILQAFSVWIILLPAAHGISVDKYIFFNFWHWLGIALWTIGFVLESVADWQKFMFKQNPNNALTWISTGVWRYSRHPNYFGEMLCWWGIFIIVAPQLSNWSWLTVASPLYITLLLLFGSGIPTLEKSYKKRFADNREYQKYKQSTSLLIPLPPKS